MSALSWLRGSHAPQHSPHEIQGVTTIRLPDPVTESADREAAGEAAATQVRADDRRYLRAAELPPPYGPDPVVFGPRRPQESN